MATATGRLRAAAFYTVAGIATFLTAGLTFGSAGELLDPTRSTDEHVVFVAHTPWLGLCFCAAFAAMLWRPRRRPAAFQQAAASTLGMYVAGFLAREQDPVFYIGFGTVLLLLWALHPARRTVLRLGAEGLSPLLVPMALVAAAPLSLYAARMLALHRAAGEDGAFYLGIAATAVTVPLVALVAGLRAPGHRLPLWVAGVTLAVLCAGSLAYPGASVAMPQWAAWLGVLGAAAFVWVGEWERRGLRRAAQAGSTADSRSGTVRRSAA
jgi:hypothetical protein